MLTPEILADQDDDGGETETDVEAENQDGSNVRMLNVRQPWASLLVLGIKDVENRAYALSVRYKLTLPVWLVIIASKNKVAPKDLRDARERMRVSGERKPLPTIFPSGVVGVVRIVSCLCKMSTSVWYNGDSNFAWYVDKYYALERPLSIRAPGSMTLLYIQRHPERDNIVAALFSGLPCRIHRLLGIASIYNTV